MSQSWFGLTTVGAVSGVCVAPVPFRHAHGDKRLDVVAKSRTIDPKDCIHARMQNLCSKTPNELLTRWHPPILRSP